MHTAENTPDTATVIRYSSQLAIYIQLSVVSLVSNFNPYIKECLLPNHNHSVAR